MSKEEKIVKIKQIEAAKNNNLRNALTRAIDNLDRYQDLAKDVYGPDHGSFYLLLHRDVKGDISAHGFGTGASETWENKEGKGLSKLFVDIMNDTSFLEKRMYLKKIRKRASPENRKTNTKKPIKKEEGPEESSSSSSSSSSSASPSSSNSEEEEEEPEATFKLDKKSRKLQKSNVLAVGKYKEKRRTIKKK